MAPTGKKKMKAALKVDPWDEMDSKRKAWLLSIPAFKKTFKTFEYSRDLELDPRKWDAGKLAKALKALVRYELKLLDARAAEWQKKIAKKGPLAQRDAEKQYPAYYKEIAKKITDKCSIALDEVEADKGDNKKGLRDGKVALKKLEGVDFKKIFSYPRKATAFTFRDLAVALNKAGSDDKKKEEAFKAANKAAGEARKGFDGDGKNAQAAIKFLLKAASDIKKNKNANPLLKTFGLQIEKLAKHLALFAYKLDEFESELDDAANALKKKKMSAGDAKAMSGRIAAFTALDKTGSKVQSAMLYLKSAFAKVEKQLK